MTGFDTMDEIELRNAREKVALAWCAEATKNTEMDVILAEEFAKILLPYMKEPHQIRWQEMEMQIKDLTQKLADAEKQIKELEDGLEGSIP